MSNWHKYRKRPCIIGAFQLNANMNLGDLGSMDSGDYVLQLYDGTLHSMSETDFPLKYVETLDTAILEGDDWN